MLVTNTALLLVLTTAPAQAASAPVASADRSSAPAAESVAAYWEGTSGTPGVYAGGGSDVAFQVCCATSACTFQAISDCDLLSPAGKVVAMGSAGVGGIGGFLGGVAVGSLLYGSLKAQNVPIPEGDNAADSLLAFSFTAGALGVVLGALAGGTLGIGVDAALIRTFDPFSPYKPAPPRDSGGYVDPPVDQTPEGDPPPLISAF